MKDVGQHLPFAKKDIISPQEASNSEVSLKNLWEEPNWKQWCLNGLNPEVCVKMYLYYKGLRKKPRSAIDGITENQWEKSYIQTIQYLKTCFPSVTSLEHLDLVKKNFYSSFYDPEKSEQPSLVEHYQIYAGGRGAGRTFHPTFNLTKRSSYLAKLLPKLGWPYGVEPSKVKLFPVLLTDTTTRESRWHLCEIRGKSFRYKDIPEHEFSTEKEAIEYIKNKLNLGKTLFIPRKPLVKMKETHKDFGNLKPEMLINLFNFRGIQFGNSLTEVESQRFVNNAYCSFKLLSQILNIPPAWIGLHGLGLAFGARGHGNASAHYEPDLHIINLTRLNGAGSIAHEWFHAMDAKLAAAFGLKNVLLSEIRIDVKKVSDQSLLNRYEAFNALKSIVARKNSNHYKNAINIASQKNSPKYWAETSELLARGFEAYIQDRSLLLDRSTDWLAFGTRVEDYIDDPDYKTDFHPYPLAKERLEFNQTFKECIRVLFSRN